MKKIKKKLTSKERKKRNQLIRYFASYITQTEQLENHINKDCIGITSTGTCDNKLHHIAQRDFISSGTPPLPDFMNYFQIPKYQPLF